MYNAKIIDDSDNVIVAIYEIKKGERVEFMTNAGNEEFLTAQSDIPLFHKIARKEILRDNDIVKYGECIGIAGTDIFIGEHVHTHNVGTKQ